jgi:hypothetical protein
MDHFAQAILDLSENQVFYTQWCLQAPNALEKTKTIDDLNIAAEELSSQPENVLFNMDSAIKEILFNMGWTSHDAATYYMGESLLP